MVSRGANSESRPMRLGVGGVAAHGTNPTVNMEDESEGGGGGATNGFDGGWVSLLVMKSSARLLR